MRRSTQIRTAAILAIFRVLFPRGVMATVDLSGIVPPHCINFIAENHANLSSIAEERSVRNGEPLSAAVVLRRQTIPNHTLHAILIEDCIFFCDATLIPTGAPPSSIGGMPPVTPKLLIGTPIGITLGNCSLDKEQVSSIKPGWSSSSSELSRNIVHFSTPHFSHEKAPVTARVYRTLFLSHCQKTHRQSGFACQEVINGNGT